jgi:hypothetical protein
MRAAGDVPNAGRIVRDNVYGWFQRVDRGVYALTLKGAEELAARAAAAAPGTDPAARVGGTGG